MNILILDPVPLFRHGVRALISERWENARFQEAGSLTEVLDGPDLGAWDLGVVDPALPDSQGLEALPRLQRTGKARRLLVMSVQLETDYATRVINLGAAGYLSKLRPREDLQFAVQRVLAGGRYISPELAEYLADASGGRSSRGAVDLLSTQEYRVMLQIIQGQRVTDIARTMFLSPKTVSTYRGRILEKLGVRSNAELVRYCLQYGLMPESS